MLSRKPAENADLWRGVLLPGAVASAVLLAVQLAMFKWQLPFPRDLHGFVLGRDFLNFWTYGSEAWNPAAGRFYDVWAYDAHLVALTGWDYPLQQWSYPPHLMLLMAPFGLLPYLPAYLLWLGVGLLALWWAVPEGFPRGRGVLALALAPAGLVCLVSGQNSFIALAILVGAFRALDSRPVLAGILLGLLTVKPQLGLLFPLALLISGRWKVFVSAALTTAFLVAATALICGPEIWATYYNYATSVQELILRAPKTATLGLMPTAYMNARILGLSPEAAYGVQALFALAAVAATVWTFWKPRDPLLSYAVLIVAGLCATPYLMSYDLVIVGWLLIAVFGTRRLAGRQRPFLLVVHFLPLLAIAAAIAGIPGSALVLPAFCLWLLTELRNLGEGSFAARHALGDPSPSLSPQEGGELARA